MTNAEQRKIGQELYRQWAALWNGELFIAHRIIADGFTVHLSADAPAPDEPVRDARGVALWVAQVRAGTAQMRYRVELGPLIDGEYISGCWRVSGVRRGPAGGAAFERIGMDVLRFRGGRLTGCRTLSNAAAPGATAVFQPQQLEFA